LPQQFGATPVWAVDVTGNGSLVSEYVWRGVPASDEKAAVQLGADAEWDNGWYAGAWGSNAATADQSGVEIDLYGGWGVSPVTGTMASVAPSTLLPTGLRKTFWN